jgi:hypothetical protein
MKKYAVKQGNMYLLVRADGTVDWVSSSDDCTLFDYFFQAAQYAERGSHVVFVHKFHISGV